MVDNGVDEDEEDDEGVDIEADGTVTFVGIVCVSTFDLHIGNMFVRSPPFMIG